MQPSRWQYGVVAALAVLCLALAVVAFTRGKGESTVVSIVPTLRPTLAASAVPSPGGLHPGGPAQPQAPSPAQAAMPPAAGASGMPQGSANATLAPTAMGGMGLATATPRSLQRG